MARAIGRVAAFGTWQRRSYLVDRHFQLKYALMIAAVAGAVAVALGLWLQQAHHYALLGAGLDFQGRRALEASYRVLFVAFAGVAVAVTAGLGWLGVRMTHRVAGPALMMRRYLTSFAAGRYPRVRTLRRSDELSELFVTVAAAIEQARARDARQVEQLEDALIALRSAADRAPELLPVAERLQAAVEERRSALELATAGTPPAAASRAA
ncbi:MAG TPA: hypothetical protein VLT47_00815 [Anaeromyxobacteraceae bacterium]|nr:hypothetical protein [Anaeromyxobacteraceae bacterium]